jgi:DNA ligase 1
VNALLWKPLLAATLPAGADLGALPYPVFASPKVDGFRVMVQRGVAVSRKGIPYRNLAVQGLYGRPEYEGLDGELCVGPPYAGDVFNRTQNCVNSGKEAAAEEFRKHGALWVIDVYSRSDFMRRNAANKELFNNKPQIHLIKQTLVCNEKQLRVYEEKQLACGYEGVMLRRGDAGPYPQKPGKDNRSTLREFDLVKLKRFDHGFATIVECRPLEHNVNEEKTAAGKRSTKRGGIVVDAERVGSVVLRDRGRTFSVNVQTKALRDRGPGWWRGQVGKRVRYTHQSAGSLEAPRFPQATFEELEKKGE